MSKFTTDEVEKTADSLCSHAGCPKEAYMLRDLASRLRQEEEDNRRGQFSEKSVLREIARIAHAGGLEGLGMGESLVLIRKLSLPYWDKEGATIIRRREVQQ